MTPIRPLERGDLPAVASLFERVMRSGSRDPAPGLAEELGRLTLDHPWADPEIPSHVYENPDGRIVGFLGSHVRRAEIDGRPLRLACSGQLVADPEHGKPGTGALLVRKHMAGPQDFSYTDGANEPSRAMWQSLRGDVNAVSSIGWMRVLRPVGLAGAVAERRRSLPGPVAKATEALASLGSSRLAPWQPEQAIEDLSADALLEQVAAARVRLRPAYDRTFLDWLLTEMAAITERGELRLRIVRGAGDRALGWFVYYLKPGGISEVQQLWGEVMPHLLWDAAEGGSAAVRGRLEPALLPQIQGRAFVLRRTEWQLVHARDRDLLGAVALGDALLTRMEGEWWMGPHLPSLGRASAA